LEFNCRRREWAFEGLEGVAGEIFDGRKAHSARRHVSVLRQRHGDNGARLGREMDPTAG